MLVFERFRGPILPTILIGTMVLLWVLSTVSLVGTPSAVLAIGGLMIALALFMGLRDTVDVRTSGSQACFLAGFAIVLALATFYPLHRGVFLPAPIAAANLRTDGVPLEVHTDGAPGPYRVVVEGHFPYTETRTSQSIHYHLKLDQDATAAAPLQGDFSERWSMARLGRRGSAPVLIARSSDQHEVEAGANGFRLELDQLSPPAAHDVSVSVHPDTFPTTALGVLGAALAAAAIVVDAWRSTDGTEGLMTSLTLAALLAAGSFRRFARPHPGLGDLAVFGAAGAILGYALGAALWRTAGPAVRSRLAR